MRLLKYVHKKKMEMITGIISITIVSQVLSAFVGYMVRSMRYRSNRLRISSRVSSILS